jgi:hypothetical protein
MFMRAETRATFRKSQSASLRMRDKKREDLPPRMKPTLSYTTSTIKSFENGLFADLRSLARLMLNSKQRSVSLMNGEP